MEYPKPQKYLSAESLVIYKEICKHLSDVDALEDIDSYGLSMLAHLLFTHQRAANEIDENGPIQKYKTGAEQISAWFTVYDRTLDKFNKLSVKFGMTNSDREKLLKFKGHKKVEDALDKL